MFSSASQNERNCERHECAICNERKINCVLVPLEKEIDCVLFPCGHQRTCYGCVEKLNDCPICRKIDQRVKPI